MNHPKHYNGIIGALQKKREKYQPIAIGDIRTVSDSEWAEHWRPHGSGWQNPSPDNLCYLKRAYGGSDMGVLMGVSHFKTRLELFNQKAGITPVFTRSGNKDAKDLGHLYESPTAMKYHALRRKNGGSVTMFIDGKTILPDGTVRRGRSNNILENSVSMQMYRDGRFKKGSVYHWDNMLYPWALANCDGFLSEDGIQGILEIKTTSPANYDVINDWKNGIVPESYYFQCIYYMSILNVMFCDICCSWDQTYDGTAVIRIYRDYDAEEKLMNAVAEFDEYVEQGITPDAQFDNGSLLNNYYYELFGPTDPKKPMVELPEKFRSTIMRAIDIDNRIDAAQKVLNEAKAQREAIYSELYPLFGSSSYGQFRVDDKTVAGITLKTPMKRAKLNEEAFKNDYPSLYEQCKVFSSTELESVDKKLKKKYMLPAEPDLEDKSKSPYFTLKLLNRPVAV